MQRRQGRSIHQGRGESYVGSCRTNEGGIIRTISVSELVTFQDCQRKHYFNYERRLRRNSSGPSWQQASGVAVHYVIEQHCRNRAGEIPHRDDVDALIFESLDADFKGNEASVKKYTPGVRRALSKVPEWVWREAWYLEHDLELFFDVGLYYEHTKKFTLIGRPDAYHVGESFVELVDFKTTATNPLTFILFTPQLRYYALMLKAQYPDKLVRYQYMCLPTQGTGPGPGCSPVPFTQKALKVTEAEIVATVASMGDDEFRNPRYTRSCDFCEFKELCQTVVTGGDWEGVAKEEYYVRD